MTIINTPSARATWCSHTSWTLTFSTIEDVDTTIYLYCRRCGARQIFDLPLAAPSPEAPRLVVGEGVSA